jgi:ABC-2 type transport system permease protein
LPPFWHVISKFNHYFYMLDRFPYGFCGLSDVAPTMSLAIVGACCLALSAVALALLRSGWRLRY